MLIAADEDCLVQSKRTATNYIIFSGIVNNSFSPITGNRITNLISFDTYIYIEENKFGVILLPIIYICTHRCSIIYVCTYIYRCIYIYICCLKFIVSLMHPNKNSTNQSHIYIYIYICYTCLLYTSPSPRDS